MMILKLDRKESVFRLSLQTLEDLWHLYKILEPGDFVRAKTYRKSAVKRGHEIIEGNKKPVNLTIKLESSEFHQYTGKLRLSGTIVSGPEDIQLASKHTITAEPGMVISIKKLSLKDFHIARLQKARVKEADIFICALDREQADFALLGEMGLEMKGSVRFLKTDSSENREEFYSKILQTLSSQPASKIIICGPGFERSNIFSWIRKKDMELSGKISLEHSSEIGKPGIQEILKRSGDKILKETRLARETAFVDRLLLELKKGGLAVYRKEDVQKSIEYGSAETVLVLDSKVREFESILDSAEKISAKIIIISADHQAGEQLQALGGIAAILRFRV